MLQNEKSDFQKRMNGYNFIGYTDTTILSADELFKNIKESDLKDWTVDDKELDPGIRCIAAPIYIYTGKIIAVISISGDKQIISKDRDEEIGEVVKNIAERI